MHFVQPIKAAAGIILTNESKPRVLLARRSPVLRFMAGYHVFPGGRIDDEEPTATVVGTLDPTEAKAVHAVAREIFEETGLLITEGSLPDRETIRAARLAVLDAEDTFDAFLYRHNLRIDATRFKPAGDWVTPAIAPIRFDTRYYICRVPAAKGQELHIGEIDALDWYTPADARNAWREGRIQLPPPVAYVLQNLAAYSFPEVLDHLSDCGEHTGERPSKMEFANGIYVLPLRSPTLPPATHTNCIIIGERDLYLIDPAADDEEERGLLIRQIKMLEELGGTVKAIILTHSHIDHVCAAEFCRTTYNAPIWAHKETARQLGNVVADIPPLTASDGVPAVGPTEPESGIGSEVSGLVQYHSIADSLEPLMTPHTGSAKSEFGSSTKPQTLNPKPGLKVPPPLDERGASHSAIPETRNPKPALHIDHYLNDGDIIEIPGTPNWQLRALHTPGHDPGHLCFIEQSTRTLIGADIIANPGTILISLDHGGDMTQFIDSLQRIANEPGYDTILPAHGMPLTKGPEKIQKHLDHRLHREQKIKDALATGATTIPELLPLAYDDVPPETWPLAEFSLRAHLKRLNIESK